MRGKRCVFIVLLSVFLCRDLLANQSGGGDIWAFLSLGVGAKPMAFGGSYVAIADDSNASYWNPAGLGPLKNAELTLMHSSSNSMTDTGAHQYMGASVPTAFGSLGASFIRFSLKDIPHTVSDKYGEVVNLGLFRSDQQAVIVSYGKSLGKVFHLGASLRRMGHRFLSYSSSGWGWDAGFIMGASQLWVVRNFRVGYIFKNNLSRKWKGDDIDSSYEESGETEYRWGLGFDPIGNEKFGSTLAFSFNQVNAAPGFISVGGEIRMAQEAIAIRGGVNNWYLFERRHSPFSMSQLNYARQLTAGLGAEYGSFQVDYAAIFERFGLKHLISLTLTP